METLQSTIFIEFDVNTKKITFLRGDNIIDYDSNATSVYVRVKYKNLSGNTVYLTSSELEDYKFSLYTIKPATNNINVITGEVTDELKENVYGGVVKFEIPRVCTNRLGIVKCEIHINQENKIIGSSTFVLDVKQSLVTAFDDELLGDEDFPVLKQLILEIQKASNIDDVHVSKITTYSSDKIETIKEEVSSQIKDIENTKANKNEVFSMANMGQDIKEAMTGGSVAIVGRNTVLTENIVDNQITPQKINKNEVVVSTIHLVESDMINKNYFVNENDQLEGLEEYGVSDYILLGEFDEYEFKNCNGETGVLNLGCYYDSNKVFLGILPKGAEQVKSWKKPDDAVYIRVNMKLDELANNYIKCISKMKFKLEWLDFDGYKLNPKNLLTFNENLINVGYTDGAYIYDGNIMSTDGYSYSNFIKVEKGETYIIYSQDASVPTIGINSPGCYYDDNKQYLGNLPDGTDLIKEFTVPENCAYVILNSATSYKTNTYLKLKAPELSYDWLIINKNNLSTELLNIIENNKTLKLINKTCNFVGDSITEMDVYQGLVAKDTGIVPTSLKGIASSTIAINNSYLQNKSIVERVCGLNGNSEYEDADIWTIFGGTNDWLLCTPLGGIDSNDNTTFYGALKQICENIINRTNNPKLILFTPLQSNRNGENSNGIKMEAYRQAIKDVADYYSIPVLDLYGIGGINPVNLNSLTLDGVHPNQQGFELITPKIVQELLKLY